MTVGNNIFEFLHPRINKRKIGNSVFNPATLDQNQIKDIQQELSTKINSETTLKNINELFKVQDITGETGGTIQYQKASVQNHLTKVFLSLYYTGPQTMNETKERFTRNVKGGFEDKSEEVKSWVEGAKIEAQVIYKILQKNKQPTTNIEHKIGCNNLTDAMYAIDFFEEIPEEKTLRLVQVKTLNNTNRSYDKNSLEVKNIFDRQKRFLYDQKEYLNKYFNQNQITFDDAMKVGVLSNESLREYYEQSKEKYLDSVMNIESKVSQFINLQEKDSSHSNVNNDLTDYFYEVLEKESQGFAETALSFAYEIESFYELGFLKEDFEEFSPENEGVIQLFFTWLEGWLENKQAKMIQILEKKYDKIDLVYHAENLDGEVLSITETVFKK
jgi:hypothetical protein